MRSRVDLEKILEKRKPIFWISTLESVKCSLVEILKTPQIVILRFQNFSHVRYGNIFKTK